MADVLCRTVPGWISHDRRRRAVVAVFSVLALGAQMGCAEARRFDAGLQEHDAGEVTRDADPEIVDSQADDTDAEAGGEDAAALDASAESGTTDVGDASTREDASAACSGDRATHELYVFDSLGPTSLLTGLNVDKFTQELVGTVMGQGQGFPSDAAPNGTLSPERPEEFSFVRVSEATHTWTIALRNVSGFAVRDGTRVKVQLAYEWGGFSPEHKLLSLRAGGQLAFFFVQGAAVDTLPVPDEVAVTQDDEVCRHKDDCGSWASYALGVSADGTTATLLPGEQKDIGDFSVTHAGDDQQLPTSGTSCEDWFVSRSELIAVRKEPLGPLEAPCLVTNSSSLAGVHIEFPQDVPCRFSVGEASAGIAIPYSVVIDADVPGVVRSPNAVSLCMPAQATDIWAFEELSGNGRYYGLTDLGRCPDPSATPVTLKAGTNDHTFHWQGNSWMGPSDTGQPMGAAFPPGIYTLRISASGTQTPPGGAAQPYEVVGTLKVFLAQ